MPPSQRSRKRLDLSSLALVLLCLISGVYAHVLISEAGMSPLLIVPSVVGATYGLLNITKWEVPRD